MKINELLIKKEGQTFEKKSIQVEPKALAVPLIAFANADGGTLAIGLSDKEGRIEGVDLHKEKVNDILRVPFDFCRPTVETEVEYVECIDEKGQENHILLMHVEPSMDVHTNQQDEVFLRVGDKSKKLTFDDRIQLTYDKGKMYFEDSPVPDADIYDLDLNFVDEYLQKINYSRTAMEYLMQNKGFVKEKNGKLQISAAAILLFGKNPQNFFPRARVRFIKYEGVEEKPGVEMNVIKDVTFEGNILKMIEDSLAFIQTQIKEKTYLGDDGRFVTEVEYPKFVCQELIVNAITHTDYSIRGTDIQIKMFDDKLVVENPGRLPGLVKKSNLRETHFSRNPKIASFLRDHGYVKEFGEGIDRMCRELENCGMMVPEYVINGFILQVTVYNAKKNSGRYPIIPDHIVVRENGPVYVIESNPQKICGMTGIYAKRI